MTDSMLVLLNLAKVTHGVVERGREFAPKTTHFTASVESNNG